MIRLSAEDLAVGMVVRENIITNTGAMLAINGSVLTESRIERIKSWKVKQVLIDENSLPELNTSDESYVDNAHNTRKKYKELFMKLSKKEEIDLDEVKKIMGGLMSDLREGNDILGKIRQIKAYDDYTYKHSVNVCMLSNVMGRWLGYTERDMEQLSLSALFHDIGKSLIRKEIIEKPGSLSKNEFETMKKHAQYGYDLMIGVPGVTKEVLAGILQHHEREDGKGYPYGIPGKSIHEFAKIIAVCDVFDAMTTNRSYKRKESPFEVAEYLSKNSFGVFDTKISSLFLDNISKSYVGNEVVLNSGQQGKIVFLHRNTPNRPIVKVGDEYVDLLSNVELKIEDVIG